MARKKLSEMTPVERVSSRMKGMTWEEAEDVGVEILAKCVAIHLYAHEDGEEYYKKLMKRILKHCDEWAGKNAVTLALASAGHRLKKGMEEHGES